MTDSTVEAVARAMFEAWPIRAVSPALAEQAGVPIGTPLTWDTILELGGNHDGLLRLAEAAVAWFSALPSPEREPMREALVRAYREGAKDVHDFLAKMPDDERQMLLRDDCPDLTEAAHTYAAAALAPPTAQSEKVK